MHAIAVESFGTEPQLMDLPKPQPGPGQVRVKLEASGINPIDWRIADGMLKDRLPHRFPLILGIDGVGIIDAIGEGVRRFTPGTRVVGQFLFGQVGEGCHAEYAILHEDATLVPCPETVSISQAAALPTAGITALQLSQRLDLAPRSTVLIIGATGGVGSFLTQLAVMKGLRVIATARQDAQSHMRALGASETLDYQTLSIDSWLDEHYPKGVDALVDLTSDAVTFSRYTSHVRSTGIALSTIWSAQDSQLTERELRGGNFETKATAEDLSLMLASVAAGKLKVTIERQIPLVDAAKALTTNRNGGARGKSVIII
ncbi:NADP-dependent oxidoreductase [Serratia quinivorans]|uniref:NADP-dependent oxidoreductase n=1 Tax=Serratia quinivorans TaxID=137545 RepID=UPI003F96FA3C